MTTSSEPQGDYGYDLVHEDVRARRVDPPEHAQENRDPLVERRTDGRANVVSGDYSYDQAHGY